MNVYRKSGVWKEDLFYENTIVKTLFDKVFSHETNQINWQDLKFFCELYEIKDIEIVVELACHFRDESNKYISFKINKKQNDLIENNRFKSFSKVRY